MIKLSVIGDPISHSLSPAVHMTVMKTLGIECEYLKVQVKKGELEDFLRFAIENKIDGFNLTMPHKIDILPYLEEMDKEAEMFQSVNTVKVKDGKFYGYNTDARGYVEAIENHGKSFLGNTVVIFGAGGVARTLVQKAVMEKAARIKILSRKVSDAEKLCAEVKEKGDTLLSAIELSVENMKEVSKDCDILINATPLGMQGIKEDFSDFSFLYKLPKDALVSDLIYHPEETNLLKAAKERGLSYLNGMGMLIYQGIFSDEIYTDTTICKKDVYPLVHKAIRDELDK